MSVKNFKILITGGTGFIGTALINKLITSKKYSQANELEIHVITRKKNMAPIKSASTLVKFYECDLNLIDRLPSNNYDIVIHAASPSSMERFSNNLSKLDRFNCIVQGTEKLLRLSRTAKFQKLIFISSGAVYGPQNALPPKESNSIAISTNDDFFAHS